MRSIIYFIWETHLGQLCSLGAICFFHSCKVMWLSQIFNNKVCFKVIFDFYDVAHITSYYKYVINITWNSQKPNCLFRTLFKALDFAFLSLHILVLHKQHNLKEVALCKLNQEGRYRKKHFWHPFETILNFNLLLGKRYIIKYTSLNLQRVNLCNSSPKGCTPWPLDAPELFACLMCHRLWSTYQVHLHKHNCTLVFPFHCPLDIPCYPSISIDLEQLSILRPWLAKLFPFVFFQVLRS